MEDPRPKFSTGTQMSVQGHELLRKDGGARLKSHGTSKSVKELRSSTYDPLLPRIRGISDRDSNGAPLNCLDDLSAECEPASRITNCTSIIQDGVADFLIRSPPSVCTSNSECDSVKFDADYDDKKVDEWLKSRSDSLSSIVLEMKANSDDYLCAIPEIGRLSPEPPSDKGETLIASSFAPPGNAPEDLHGGVNSVHSLTESNLNSIGDSNNQTLHETAASLGFGNGLDELVDRDSQELLEQSKKALQSLPPTGFRNCETSLLTLQELERLPKTGLSLEFEADLDCMEKPKESQDNPIILEQNILQDDQSLGPHITVCSEDQNQPPNNADDVDGDKSDMKTATLSITTNKENNTIQIVVNEQGGQVIQVCDASALALQQALEQLLSQASVVNIAVPETIDGLAGLVTNDGTNEHIHLVKNNEDAVSNDEPSEADNSNVTDENANDSSKDGENVIYDPNVRHCPYVRCNRTFGLNEERKFKMHVLSHSERIYKCSVEGCEWAFSTENRLRRHMESHIGKKDYVCDVEGCNKRFTTVYNLKTHKNLHKRANSIACPSKTCSLTFATKRQMELHLREHQEVPAPYKCPIPGCGKECYSSNSLSSHLRVHKHSENDLKCTFKGCEKIFDKVCRLKEHVRQHTGERPYACEYEGCKWSFISSSKLTRHMRKHTGERKFQCPEPGCGKSFLRPEHLKGHSIVHSGGRPFKCPHENCSSSFTAKSSLYIHLKKHKNTEKLVYPCPVESCQKKYSCKTSLRIHLRKFHSTSLESDPPNIVALLSKEELQEIATMDGWPELAAVSVANDNTANTVVASGPAILGTQLIAPDIFVTQEYAFANIIPAEENGSTHLLVTPDISSYDSSKDQSNKSAEASLSAAADNGGVMAPAQVAEEDTTPTEESGVILTPDDWELLTSPRILQENNSGSARTDYCSNYILSSRAKRRRLLQLQQEKAKLSISIKDTSKSAQLIPTSPFQDDMPLLSGEIYQDEVLTTSVGDLTTAVVPLLSSASDASSPIGSSASDFGSSSVSVGTFPMSMNLQDLV